MCSHGVVLRVVAELLGDDGVAEEEVKVGEHIIAGGRDGAGSRELPCAGGINCLSHFVCLEERRFVVRGLSPERSRC